MRVEADVVLGVPPAEAWIRLLDWERQADWMRDADRVEVLTSHRQGAGVRVAVKTRVLGIPLFTERLEVTAWEPPRRIELAHRSLVRGRGEWRLEPVDGGARTRFTWSEDLSLGVPVLGPILLACYRPFMRWLMRGSLGNLQRRLPPKAGRSGSSPQSRETNPSAAPSAGSGRLGLRLPGAVHDGHDDGDAGDDRRPDRPEQDHDGQQAHGTAPPQGDPGEQEHPGQHEGPDRDRDPRVSQAEV